jgi:UPF0755 protein
MKHFKYILIIGPALLLIIASFFLINRYITYNKPNTTEGTRYLYIYRNATYNDVCDSIKKLNFLLNPRSFGRAARKLNLENSFKPGRYKIEHGMSNKKIIVNIILNNEEPVKLVIAGSVRSRERLAQIIDRRVERDYNEILSYLDNDSIANSYGFNKYTFISMFLPDTYEIYWTTTIPDLLDKLKKQYDRFWNPERTRLAEKMNFTKEQISTLASIVYEESKDPKEQPVIAGVYINRLKAGIPLQADPTVIFANNDFSIRRVLKKHLAINNPYNTYKFKGLPPGPISMAPPAVIDAVLNYTRHKYLYFCASPDFNGTHLFAVNHSGHEKNAAAYRRALNKRNILK